LANEDPLATKPAAIARRGLLRVARGGKLELSVAGQHNLFKGDVGGCCCSAPAGVDAAAARVGDQGQFNRRRSADDFRRPYNGATRRR